MNAPLSTTLPFTCACGPTKHVVAQFDRVRLPAAHERVLHDHASGAHRDVPVLAGDDGAEQDTRFRADPHVAAEHGGGSHVGGFVDGGALAAVLHQHGLVV
jgi:hypothetical protein